MDKFNAVKCCGFVELKCIDSCFGGSILYFQCKKCGCIFELGQDESLEDYVTNYEEV